MILHCPRISVIVVNWNGKEHTLECLESLGSIDYPNFEVVVVDNGSQDNSVQAIQKIFPGVALLETGDNLGFAVGNNMGIRYSLDRGADYLFLLNNDTVVDPQILNSFVAALRQIGEDAILGAKIYYYSKPTTIWYAGARWLPEISGFKHIGQGRIDNDTDFNAISETDYACGCALFVSAGLLNRIGLLDETFYLTFEETDLCYRARRSGHKSFFVPEAKVWHKISTAFGGENSVLYHYFLLRNKLLWAEKNLSFSERLGVYSRVSNELLRYVLPPPFRVDNSAEKLSMMSIFSSLKAYREKYRQKKNAPLRKAKLWAVRDYFLRRFGNCPDCVRALGNK
jgi:GT2 family glycosyltransferase